MGGDLGLMAIGNLSGGQKSRVAFAVATWRMPHLLILDEPTNFLDLETIELLIDSLKSFTGCVLLVSHDRYFLSQVSRIISLARTAVTTVRRWPLNSGR